MSDIRDFTGKNRKFTGTDSIKLPSGSTAQRVGGSSGEIRFNSDLNLAEYYDGANWKAIDAPPTISSVQVDSQTAGVTNYIVIAGGTTSTILINGSLFDTTNGTVTIAPQGSGSNVTPVSLTRTSASQFSVVVTQSDFTEAGEPYDITITNGSNLSATLSGALTSNSPPTFATAADTNVGSIATSGSDFSGFTSVAATDADGDTITHTISAGSLPTGISLATNGTFSGTVDSGATIQNYTFTVQAATSFGTSTRQFVLTVTAPPGDAEYTSAGTFTWTVPAGITNVSIVCIGAGGTSGIGNSGQAGGGGALAYRNSISVTPGTTGTVVVGGSSGRSGNNGQTGGLSSFTYGATTTTAGGGGGGGGDGGGSGGSAGGGGTRSGTYDGGGNGGSGGQDVQNAGGPGGGGAGGYSGNGGGGAGGYAPTTSQAGSSGSGGGGGGGGKGGSNEGGGGGGGGVGFYGLGTSGAGGSGQPDNNNGGSGGGAGSGGSNGGNGENSVSGGQNSSGGQGGAYGGGQGGTQSNGSNNSAGVGAVRIVWDPGTTPTFPSTNVGDK